MESDGSTSSEEGAVRYFALIGPAAALQRPAAGSPATATAAAAASATAASSSSSSPSPSPSPSPGPEGYCCLAEPDAEPPDSSSNNNNNNSNNSSNNNNSSNDATVGGGSSSSSALSRSPVASKAEQGQLSDLVPGTLQPVQVLMRFPAKDDGDMKFPRAMSSFCFPRGGAKVASRDEVLLPTLHGFVLTNESGDRMYGAALHLWEVSEQRDDIVVQKALAVLGTQPLWGAFHAFLSSMCRCRGIEGLIKESLIVNFVSETPLPRPGGTVTLQLPMGLGDPIVLRRPALNQLPLLDLPIKRIAEQLGPENLVTLVEALLLERRIIVHSSSSAILTATCEVLAGLMWPLCLATVYVPLLPDALVDFCGAPMPFLLGIDSKMVGRAECMCEPHTIIADLDFGSIRTSRGSGISMGLDSWYESGPLGPRPPAPERPHSKLLRRVALALEGRDFQAAEKSTSLFAARGRKSATAAMFGPRSQTGPSTPMSRQRSNSNNGLGSSYWPSPVSSEASDFPGTPSKRSSAPSLLESFKRTGSPMEALISEDNRGEITHDNAFVASHVLYRSPSDSISSSVDAAGDPSAAKGQPDALLRMAFARFMTDLMVDHARFSDARHEGGFDQTGFVASRHESDRPFLQEFTSTQMWSMWIGKRLDPPSSADSKDVLLFDQMILSKLNRKASTFFSKHATPWLNLQFAECKAPTDYTVPMPQAFAKGCQAPPCLTVSDKFQPWTLEERGLYRPRPIPSLSPKPAKYSSNPVPTTTTTSSSSTASATAMAPGTLSTLSRGSGSACFQEMSTSTGGSGGGGSKQDPLQDEYTAPLTWFVLHCWLLTWALFLPDLEDPPAQQHAKMDLCLGVLHRFCSADLPPPHDYALSLLAAACARAGTCRIDMARKLFGWMRARRLGALTHPRSSAVFFERFVQLCAAEGGVRQGRSGSKQPSSSLAGGPPAFSSLASTSGAPERVAKMAEAKLLAELAGRPRLMTMSWSATQGNNCGSSSVGAAAGGGAAAAAMDPTSSRSLAVAASTTTTSSTPELPSAAPDPKLQGLQLPMVSKGTTRGMCSWGSMASASASAQRATLWYNGACPFCGESLSWEEVQSQWSKAAPESKVWTSSLARCQRCRRTSKVQLQLLARGAAGSEMEGEEDLKVQLWHPKKMAIELISFLDRDWEAGDAGDSTFIQECMPLGSERLAGLPDTHRELWANLLWYFRHSGLFTEHLLLEQEERTAQALASMMRGRASMNSMASSLCSDTGSTGLVISAQEEALRRDLELASMQREDLLSALARAQSPWQLSPPLALQPPATTASTMTSSLEDAIGTFSQKMPDTDLNANTDTSKDETSAAVAALADDVVATAAADAAATSPTSVTSVAGAPGESQEESKEEESKEDPTDESNEKPNEQSKEEPKEESEDSQVTSAVSVEPCMDVEIKENADELMADNKGSVDDSSELVVDHGDDHDVGDDDDVTLIVDADGETGDGAADDRHSLSDMEHAGDTDDAGVDSFHHECLKPALESEVTASDRSRDSDASLCEPVAVTSKADEAQVEAQQAGKSDDEPEPILILAATAAASSSSSPDEEPAHSPQHKHSSSLSSSPRRPSSSTTPSSTTSPSKLQSPSLLAVRTYVSHMITLRVARLCAGWDAPASTSAAFNHVSECPPNPCISVLQSQLSLAHCVLMRIYRHCAASFDLEAFVALANKDESTSDTSAGGCLDHNSAEVDGGQSHTSQVSSLEEETTAACRDQSEHHPEAYTLARILLSESEPMPAATVTNTTHAGGIVVVGTTLAETGSLKAPHPSKISFDDPGHCPGPSFSSSYPSPSPSSSSSPSPSPPPHHHLIDLSPRPSPSPGPSPGHMLPPSSGSAWVRLRGALEESDSELD